MSMKLYSPLEINNRESWGRNPGKRCSCLPLLWKSTSHSSGPLWAGKCPRAGNSYHSKNLDGQDCGQVLSLQGNSHHPLYALARDQILNPSGSSERPVMLPRAGQQCLPHTGAKPTAGSGWGTADIRDEASHVLEREKSQVWAQGDTEADYWRVRNLSEVLISWTDGQKHHGRDFEERTQVPAGGSGVCSYIFLRMGRFS